MKRGLLLYFILIVFILGAILAFTNGGIGGTGAAADKVATLSFNPGLHFRQLLEQNLNASGMFIMQLIIIMLLARLMGYLFQLVGQPLVVGEIIAGIILGPSVLGAIYPDLSGFLFPSRSLDILQQLSQLGLVFFMFIIGMELDTHSFKKTASAAMLISIASIVIPFASGIFLAIYLYDLFNPQNVRLTSFALFMGITMSITAFPVLARIVQERRMTRTLVGTMAISVAAIGDVVAWCILAVVIAIAKAGDIGHSFLTIGLSILYIAFMYFVVKPLMFRIGRVYASRETMGRPIVAFVFLLILVSSLTTEIIGIHALFGAFMAGVVMPDNLNFKRIFTEKIEDVSLVILLPLFFVATGLRTEIGLINSTTLWMACLVITVTAILGKFGGTLIASRFSGLSWKNSLSLGVLMNAKGLMELIVLNIGYDLGILSPDIFAMLVIMALTTTFITGPGLNLINYFFPESDTKSTREKDYKIMLSFANPKMGGTLLKLAQQLASRVVADTTFTALHISPRSDLSPDDARIFEKESFAPIRKMAEAQKLSLSTVYRNTIEISAEIIQTCQTEKPDFVILGSARSIFSTDILGGIVRRIFNETGCDVLIFNERNFSEIRSVLLIYSGAGDEFLFQYASLLNHRGGRNFYTHNIQPEDENSSFELQNSGIPAQPVPGNLFHPAFLQTIDLVMITDKNWKTFESKNNIMLGQFPSLLIIHRSDGNNKLLKGIY